MLYAVFFIQRTNFVILQSFEIRLTCRENMQHVYKFKNQVQIAI